MKTSSLVTSIKYNDDKSLEVTLTTGGTYSYKNVPQTVAESFIGAESLGKFFNAEIKGVYEYELL